MPDHEEGESVTRASGDPAITFRIALWGNTGSQARASLLARVAWDQGRWWGCDFARGTEGWRASKCSSGDIEPYRWE